MMISLFVSEFHSQGYFGTYMEKGKSSGPLLDRIDLHIEVPAVPFQELAATQDGTSSKVMREQVSRARAVQRERFGAGNSRLNSRMSSRQLRKFCVLDAAGRQMLETAMESLGLSARAHDRILRMARTIADLEGSADIKSSHVTEAIGYRSLDRKLWQKAK
jgi:magnesium chelatase family protein